jgi:hypothetical protein
MDGVINYPMHSRSIEMAISNDLDHSVFKADDKKRKMLSALLRMHLNSKSAKNPTNDHAGNAGQTAPR